MRFDYQILQESPPLKLLAVAAPAYYSILTCQFLANFNLLPLVVVAKAIHPFYFYSGSSMFQTTVWIIFTGILNIIIVS